MTATRTTINDVENRLIEMKTEMKQTNPAVPRPPSEKKTNETKRVPSRSETIEKANPAGIRMPRVLQTRRNSPTDRLNEDHTNVKNIVAFLKKSQIEDVKALDNYRKKHNAHTHRQACQWTPKTWTI